MKAPNHGKLVRVVLPAGTVLGYGQLGYTPGISKPTHQDGLSGLTLFDTDAPCPIRLITTDRIEVLS
ncbi:hypothetical protein ATK74_0851 [Propionicimonas paludicola]|uniref:Uncharacterized protein n=1 Tax=Propionicimonas paludicola TaxID=185243 RepID=A0A2A9CPD0_9ACTN|nr:hypothetical protein [Propionicimonas paludicola]PFG16317.1 hypothetical protein ATK74_0851 [Propionicimonas paludicola]